MRHIAFALVLSAWLGGVACSTTIGQVQGDRFEHEKLALDILTLPNKAMLNPQRWRHLNGEVRPDGAVNLKESVESDFFIDRADGSTKIVRWPVDEFYFDDPAALGDISIRTRLLGFGIAPMDTDAMARSYLESLSGSTSVGVSFSRQTGSGRAVGVGVSQSKRYTTRTLSSSTLVLAGQTGTLLDFELVDADRFAVDPNNATDRRVRLVIVKLPDAWPLPSLSRSYAPYVAGQVNKPPPVDTYVAPSESFPVALILEYRAEPKRFEAGLTDFMDLVGRVRFREVPKASDPAPGATSGTQGADGRPETML